MFLGYLLLSTLLQKEQTNGVVLLNNNSQVSNSTYTWYDYNNYISNHNFNQIKSKFGNVDFQVRLAENSSCQTSYLVEANHNFNFPAECTCINSNFYCLQELIQQPYFLKYIWNFSNYSYDRENISHFNYLTKNISSCILNKSRTLNTEVCFPCEDYYISVEAIINRRLCWMVNIVFLLIVICFLCGICFFIFGIRTYRNRNRNGYQRVSTNRYRFFTTN